MNYSKETEIKENKKIEELLDTLPSFVRSYIRSIENNTTTKTRLEYIRDISNFFDYIKEKNNVSEITLNILNNLSKSFFEEEYFHYIKQYEKNGKIITNDSVSLKRKLSALTGFMSFLFDSDLITNNIILKVKKPKIRHKEIIRMDENETDRFLSVVESGGTLSPKQAQYHNIQVTRDLAICYLILSTGIRVSECVGLDIKDVDFENSSLHIIRKGGKEAYVYFSDEASAYLMEYYEERKRVETKEGHEQALFLSSRKSRITQRSIQNIVKKYARQALPSKHITPHKLRSTYATALYELSNDAYLVSKNLGHEDISTVQVYADLTDSRRKDNRNLIKLKK